MYTDRYLIYDVSSSPCLRSGSRDPAPGEHLRHDTVRFLGDVGKPIHHECFKNDQEMDE